MQQALARNIPLFFVFRSLRDFHLWILVWVVYLTVEQGFTLTEVTAANSMFFPVISVLEVPTGAVPDRWGRRLSLGLGALCFAGALVLFAYATSFTLLLASFALWALADALIPGADLALLFDTLRALGRERDDERLAGEPEAAMWGGVTAATLLGAPIAAATSMQFMIWAGFAFSLFLTAVALSLVEPPCGREPAESGEPAEHHRFGYLATLAAGLRLVWHDCAVRWIVFFAGLSAATLGASMYLVQPLLLSRGADVGFAFSAWQLPWVAGAALGTLAASALWRRFGDAAILVAVVALGVAAYAALAGFTSMAVFGLFAVVAALQAMLVPIVTGYVNRRTSSAQRATVLSAQSLVRGLCFAPLGLAVGAVADARGIEWGFALLGLALALGGAIAWSLWLRAHRRAPRPPRSRPPSLGPCPGKALACSASPTQRARPAPPRAGGRAALESGPPKEPHMPIYEYFCPPCATTFEVRRPVSAALEAAACPRGHGVARRVVSAFATVRATGGPAFETIDLGGGGGGCGCGGACACGR
ncbi:MAG: hypothetical protein FJ035_08630 [Chloroflexi bacterium]|nr:hypothetical protein [Chloroflexota bacterium]